MKKWTRVLLVFLMAFLLVSCGSVPPPGNSQEEEVHDTLELSDRKETAQQEEEGDLSDENDSSSADAFPEESLPGETSSGDNEFQNTEGISSDTGEETLPEDGSYTTKDDVALYIYTYGHLPSNFITKKEAEKLGWQGGSLEPYAPGKCIGGSRFGNYEGLLPEKEGRVYMECDIDTLGAQKRGAKRIVFSNDGLIYYTEDHYESFELLYGDE